MAEITTNRAKIDLQQFDVNFIRNFDIVSFDMWDTLVCRPFAKPEDLWEYVGGLNYKKQRKKGLISFSELEIETEIELARPVNKIKKIYNEALRLGKRIVVVSDMYLPSKVLTKILNKCGYINFKLYVSCECGCSKADTLFEKIKKENQGSIIHFDDADYAIQKAREYGITAVKVRKLLWDLFDKFPRLKFLPQNTLAIRHYLGWLAQQELRSNYFRQFGLMMGVIAYGFAQFVDRVAKEKNIDTLLFLSRDMYVIHQFYQRFGNKRNKYIYHSRRISRNGKNYDWYYKNYKVGKTAIVDTTTSAYTAQGTIRADLQIYEMVGADLSRNPTKNVAPITWCGENRNRIKPNPFLELIWTEPVESAIDLIKLDNDTIQVVRGLEDKRDNTKIKEMVEGQLEFTPLNNITFSFEDCKAVFRNYIDGLTINDINHIDQLAIYQDDHHSIRRESLNVEMQGI